MNNSTFKNTLISLFLLFNLSSCIHQNGTPHNFTENVEWQAKDMCKTHNVEYISHEIIEENGFHPFGRYNGDVDGIEGNITVIDAEGNEKIIKFGFDSARRITEIKAPTKVNSAELNHLAQ